MTLRAKTLLLTAGAFLLLAALLLFFFQIRTRQAIQTFENESMAHQLRLVERIMDAEIKRLQSIAADWGAWDATHEFMVSHAPDYRSENLTDASLAALRVDWIVLISTDETSFTAKKVGSPIDMITQPEADFFRHLRPKNTPITPADYPSGISKLNNQLFMVAIHPILTSNWEGPIRGRICIARRIDSAFEQDLARTLDISIRLKSVPPSDSSMPVSIQISQKDTKNLLGVRELTDISGRPVGQARISEPRHLMTLWNAVINELSLIIGVVCLLALICISLFLDRTLLKPIARIRECISPTEQAVDPDTIPFQSRQDEIGTLAQTLKTSFSTQIQREALTIESERRLQNALEGGELAFWDWDIPGHTIYFSSRFLTMLDYAPDELPTTPESLKFLFHPDERKRVVTLLIDFISQEGHQDELLDSQFRLRKKDGNYLWVIVRGKIIDRSPEGKPTRFTGIHWDITNQRIAETGQIRLLAIAEQAPSIILSFTRTGQIIYMNPAGHRFWGTGFLSGQLKKGLSTGAAQRLFSTGIETAESTGSWTADITLIKPDHTEVLFLAHLLPHPEPMDPGTTTFSAILTDTTHLRREEETLVNIALGMTDTGGNFYVSLLKQLTKVLDADYAFISSIIPGTTSMRMDPVVCGQEAIPPMETKFIGTPCEQVLKEGVKKFQNQICERFPQANLLSQLGIKGYIGAPLQDRDNTRFGTLAILYTRPIRDSIRATSLLQIFTARASAEMARDYSLNALKESEHRYRTLFENAPDGILLMNSTMFIDCNAKTLEMFECPNTDAFIGRKPLDFSPEYQPDGTLSADEEARNISIVLTRDSNQFQWRFRTCTGRYFDVEVTLTRIDIEGQQILLAFIRDITKKLQLEQHLQQSQKLEAIGTLAGGIAHDFNNILSAILGFTELSILEAKDQPKLYKHLKGIRKGGERARKLTSQILNFSRDGEESPEPTNVADILSEVLQLIRATVPATIDIDSSAVVNACVLIDPTQLHQVLMNLCTNAAHAMQENGGVLTLTLDRIDLTPAAIESLPGLSPGPYAAITVSDTGPGMTPEIQKRIFEPFYTTKAKGEGTGLGLSVAHGIITKYGGTITLYSRIGQGTIFRIYLPEMASGSTAIDSGSTDASALIGSEHILFIDDDPLQAEVAASGLTHFGYRVHTVTDSRRAFARFAETPDDWDIVITDMTMPGLTGDQLTKKMLALRSDIPIILCTGHSEQMDAEKAKSIGVRIFLKKPIIPSQLAAMIRTVCSGNV